MKYISILAIICLLVAITYVVVGAIERSPNTIIKEDTEHIYVKKYSLYNKDSCVYKYHKPIIHKGVIINKSTRFVGLVGRGGHRVFRTYIKYDNKEYTELGYVYYNKHNE